MIDKRYWLQTAGERPCPLCNSVDFVAFTNKMQYSLNLRTVICKNCELVYTNPLPPKEIYDQFYSDAYSEYYGKIAVDLDYIHKEVVNPYIQGRLSVINSFRSLNDARILEIGPGKGTFLWWARRFGSEVFGIEPSNTFYNQLIAEGLPSFHGTVEDFEIEKKGLFDIVVMFHVLEHFYEPNKVLEKCRSLLSENGVVVIEIPNVNKPYRSLYSYFLRYVHTLNFSPKTLRAMLLKHGFEIIHIDEGGDNWHYPQNIFAIAVKRSELTRNQKHVSSNSNVVVQHLRLYQLKWHFWRAPLWYLRPYFYKLARRVLGLKRKFV